MRLGAFLSLMLCLAAPASAQSITSFEPDTTQHARGTPADKVDLPVWFGLQLAPVAGLQSRFEERELDDRFHSLPWIGASVTWPWVGPQQGWLDIGYQHWRFRSDSGTPFSPVDSATFFQLLSLSLDRFTVRSGVDQLLWRDHAVSAAIGAGFGAGFGYVQRTVIPEVDVLLNYELIAHALVFLRITTTTRIGFGASGVVSAEYASGEFGGPWQHLEFVFRLDQSLRVPKRIVPGL